MMLCRLPSNHLTVDYSDSRAGHAPFNIKFILIKKTGRVNVDSLFINNRLYNMLTCESCKATQKHRIKSIEMEISPIGPL